MNVTVGSQNPTKIKATKNELQHYFPDVDVQGISCSSGVADQPMTIEETITGAENRAKKSFITEISVGLESGLIEIPTQDKYMNICVCVIHDGTHNFYGQSSGFIHPPKVLEYVLQGFEVSEAANKAGIVDDANIGKKEGVISLYTRGRVNRTQYMQEAVRNALAQFIFSRELSE